MEVAGLAVARSRAVPRTSRSRGWAGPFAWILGSIVLLLLWSTLDARILAAFPREVWPRVGASALFAGFGSLIAWRARASLYEDLTSVRFGVAILLVLLLATVLGTVVVQAPAAEFSRGYPPGVAGVLLAFDLNEIFHSAWFRGLLALLGVSLVLVPIRRQAWRLPMWGHLLCHAGTVVILVGGALGSLLGQRASLELREGRAATEVVGTQDGPNPGIAIPLGFTVRLEDFEIEHHPGADRLLVLGVDRDGLAPLRTLDPASVTEAADVDSLGSTLKVIDARAGAVDVEIGDRGQARRKTLRSGTGDMAWLQEGRSVLVLERPEQEVKAYRSRVSVLENGREVCRKTVEVNDPLSYGGWHFYQSSFRAEDPEWTGLLAVKDPGFGVVFLGFAMIACGVLFVYYVRPRILKRRTA